MNKPIYLVDGQKLDTKGNTVPEGIPRLRLAQKLFQEETGKILLMGGKATPGINKRHCDAGEEGLLNLGVRQEYLLKETDSYGSLDTVGELLFAMKEHLVSLEAAKKIVLISSDYHEQRLLEIAQRILGDTLMQKTIFRGIPKSEHGNYVRGTDIETASLNAFRSTFAGIPIGDLKAIEDRLWKSHPLYKDHPSNPYKKESL